MDLSKSKVRLREKKPCSFGNQLVNTLVNQTQHPNGQDDGNDRRLVVHEQNGQTEEAHGCRTTLRHGGCTIHNSGVHIGCCKSQSHILADFELLCSTDGKEEGEEVENEVTNHGHDDDKAAVTSHQMQVGHKGHDCLEHTAADQNGQRGSKNAGKWSQLRHSPCSWTAP